MPNVELYFPALFMDSRPRAAELWRSTANKIGIVNVAIVDIDNEVHGVKAMPAGIAVPPNGVVRTQLMEVLVRRDGSCWVEAYHNVDVKAGAKP